VPTLDQSVLTDQVLALLAEDPWTAPLLPAAGDWPRRRMVRLLLTLREPAPMSAELARALDHLFAAESLTRPAHHPLFLPQASTISWKYPDLRFVSLWRGDISTLQAHAVMNTADGSLLGCFLPLHDCVSNRMHSAAGPRLRAACAALARARRSPLPAGHTAATRGFHLPARHVLHTVTPAGDEASKARQTEILAQCYRSALKVAAHMADVESVALSSILPGHPDVSPSCAARVAFASITGWLRENPGRFEKVVIVTADERQHRAYLDQLASRAVL
jgi:O-acetyl-ADP-ribose deacetylase (regulator of RNase III)